MTRINQYKDQKQLYFKALGNHIKDVIIEKHREQKDVAEAMGMTKQNFHNYLQGKTHFFTIPMICKLSEVLDTSTDYLLGLVQSDDKLTADICKETGFTPDAVKILREAVKDNSFKYRILIDIFEFMLLHIEMYVNDAESYFRLRRREEGKA